jgi:hypothetical protein
VIILNRGGNGSGSTVSVCLDRTRVERRCLDSSFFLSPLVDVHISTWKDARGLEPGWLPGTLGRGSSEPLVRQVVQGTSLGDIMELCRMDDVTLSISGEGTKKGEKSV